MLTDFLLFSLRAEAPWCGLDFETEVSSQRQVKNTFQDDDIKDMWLCLAACAMGTPKSWLGHLSIPVDIFR